MHQDILTFTDGSVTPQWIKHTNPKVNVWETRGWTLQEEVLSRRILIFRDNGLQWRCQEASAEEQCIEVKRSLNNFGGQKIALEVTLWPCLRNWDVLLLKYLERTIKYKEDILRAFSGILEVLSTTMHGGFHYGLPEQFFDVSLLWVPKGRLSRHGNIRTKKPHPRSPAGLGLAGKAPR